MKPNIDHINRYVSNVDKFIEFYRSSLGYELIDRGRKGNGMNYAILKGIGHEMFIAEKEGFEAVADNFRHIGYSVDNADEVLCEFKGKGYVKEGVQIIVKEFSRQFYIKDPDGFEIDIIQWTNKDDFYEFLDIRKSRLY